jgi:hypothetical protein
MVFATVLHQHMLGDSPTLYHMHFICRRSTGDHRDRPQGRAQSRQHQDRICNTIDQARAYALRDHAWSSVSAGGAMFITRGNI